MAETLDQKIEQDCISLPLSNSSGRPSLRRNRDERKTWSALHLSSAENAGCPTQGETCKGTEAPYYSTWSCNGVRRPQRRKTYCGTDRGIKGGNVLETRPAWEEGCERSLKNAEEESGMCW